MEVGKFNEQFILETIRNRIIAKTDFTESNCYFDDHAIPVGDDCPPFNVCCPIVPSDSEFDKPQQLQQSPCNLIEHGGFSIHVLKRDSPDSTNHLNQIMVLDSRSLIGYYKPLILSAMTTESANGAKVPWAPKHEGQLIFMDSIKVTGYSRPQRVKHWPMLVMGLHFSASWRWQL